MSRAVYNSKTVLFNGKMVTIPSNLMEILQGCGYNNQGQMGTGNTVTFNGIIKTLSFDAETIKEISSSGIHTFILYNDGTVQSFGANSFGQLGMGFVSSRESNIQTPSFTNVDSVYCLSGYSTMIVFNDGTVKSFGRNTQGQLFMGNTTDYAGAIQTPTLTNVKSFSGSINTTFALLNDGTIKSTGGSNNYGELGTGSTGGTIGAIRTPSFTNVKEISCGDFQTGVLFDDGTIKTFGQNTAGQLGMGNKTNYLGAIQTPAFTNVKELNIKTSNGIVTFNDGTLNTWGGNHLGMLGMGNETDYGAVIQTPSFSNVDTVSMTDTHVVIILNNKTLRTFGQNLQGQLLIGNNDDPNGEIQTPSLTKVEKVFIGVNVSFVINKVPIE